MPPRIPQVRPTAVRRVLLKLGFEERTGKGSHRVFAHADGRRTVVPMHPKPLTFGTFRSILRQIGMTAPEFLDLL